MSSIFQSVGATTMKLARLEAGDVLPAVLGAATVILAMGEGRRAAAGINAYLTTGK